MFTIIDCPVSYEIEKENPLKNLQYKEQTISYADALICMINNNEHNYLLYFEQLKTIRMDEIFTLPSGNSFQIKHNGIIFIRDGKKELRVIHTKNKKMRELKSIH